MGALIECMRTLQFETRKHRFQQADKRDRVDNQTRQQRQKENKDQIRAYAMSVVKRYMDEVVVGCANGSPVEKPSDQDAESILDTYKSHWAKARRLRGINEDSIAEALKEYIAMHGDTIPQMRSYLSVYGT